MFGLGTPEIILIAIVILVLFGAKRIPDLMHGIGKGVKEFKKATSSIEDEIKDAGREPEKKTPETKNSETKQ
ncbi:MAG: twin-arginine translocase TatA/TatE family subunit [Ignavibacteriae bacterium]|jgi:sec-independent protein translocase protein TatA|nr:twin-arginine translocase TatA/TatE family subunit [Ignavibacteriota bacterium]